MKLLGKRVDIFTFSKEVELFPFYRSMCGNSDFILFNTFFIIMTFRFGLEEFNANCNQ